MENAHLKKVAWLKAFLALAKIARSDQVSVKTRMNKKWKKIQKLKLGMLTFMLLAY